MTKPRLNADSANPNSIDGSRLIAGSVPLDRLSSTVGLSAADINYSPSGAGAKARTVQGSLEDTAINVKDFGAKGDGTTNDTIAIEAAFAYSRSTQTAESSRQMGWCGEQKAVFFPPGRYVYSGSGISQTGGSILMHAHPGTVVIRNTSDAYFLTADGVIQSTFVRGFHFLGGKGVIKYVRTGTNVTGFHSFDECYFDAYTECAIGNNSQDMPHWMFRKCIFRGDNVSGNSIGIAIGGYIDSTSIFDCMFEFNKFHLKIGPGLSGSIHIVNCAFLSFPPSGVREADIWFVPNDTNSFGNNSGFETTIERCKFGNENMVATDNRILVALEDTSSGTDRLNYQPSLTWNDTDAYFTGLTIKNNRISAIGNTTAPFIKSYIAKLIDLRFQDNFLDAGPYTYLCEFDGPLNDDNGYTLRTWLVELASTRDSMRPFVYGVTNGQTRSLTFDRYGSLQYDDSSLLTHNSLGDDCDFSQLALSVGDSDISLYGSASKVAVNDIYGSARAARVSVAEANNSGVFLSLNGANIRSNQITWIDVDLKKATVNGLNTVNLQVFNTSTNRTAVLKLRQTLTDNWRTYRIPFIFPNTSAVNNWQLRVNSGDYAAGVSTNFEIGRIRVYHGRQPMNGNHLRTLGTGAWNGERLIMGSYNLWIDSSGRLRIKNGPPTSDTDGTIVGTQS